MALSTGLAAGRTIVLPVRLGDVVMPPSLTDLFYVSADLDRADEASDRLVRDMNSHAAEVTSKKGKTTFDQASERWTTVVDKWHPGSRLPHVMHELAWRLEGLLEVAAHHERTYRRNQGVIRRLNRIVGAGIIETRELLSVLAKDPALFAPTALEDSSIPTRDELFAIVSDDPRLFTLQEQIVPRVEEDQTGD